MKWVREWEERLIGCQVSATRATGMLESYKEISKESSPGPSRSLLCDAQTSLPILRSTAEAQNRPSESLGYDFVDTA
jgi:hypothetical protein